MPVTDFGPLLPNAPSHNMRLMAHPKDCWCNECFNVGQRLNDWHKAKRLAEL